MNIFFKNARVESQRGFASLLLILAVVVASGFAGYLAFEKQEIKSTTKIYSDEFTTSPTPPGHYVITSVDPTGKEKHILVADSNGKVSNRLDIKHFSTTEKNVLKTFEGIQDGMLGAGVQDPDLVDGLLLEKNWMRQTLGANGTEIPTSVALFETSLSSQITTSATSMTLVSATDKAGTTLASSTYAFIIDEGTASEEMVLADCTGTACTNMIRGLSPVTGTTTVSTLKFQHRRGASIKITDGPQLLIVSRILNGNGDLPSLLRYKSGTSIVSGDSGQTLVTKTYAETLANQGAATSTESVGGLVELGTLAEQASSYDGGSDKPTVLQTKNSTSTCQVVGSYNIVASSTTGKLDKNCFDQSLVYTFSGNNTHSGTNTFSSTTTLATTTQSGISIGGNIANQFTAGETIATLDPLAFATSSGRVFKVKANTASTTNYIGFASGGATVGNTLYVQTDGIASGFSGLTTGTDYYASDTSTVQSTLGTYEVYLGQAVSTTQILINKNRANQYMGSGGLSNASSVTAPMGTVRVVISAVVDWATAHAQGNITLTKQNTAGSIGTSTCCSLTTGDWNVSWNPTTGVVTSSLSGGATSGSGTAYFYRQ